jgi:predicted O-methyltransferase YrrM
LVALMELVTKSLTVAGRKAHRRLRTPAELARLTRSEDAAARRVGAALQAVLDDRLDPEERAWIDRIEALRGRLLESDEQVGIVDYGAGDPELDLTDDTMAAGRVETRLVSAICRSAAKPPVWARILFKLVREFRPERCVELGTSLGVSASYQAAALELNGSGRLVSLEGAPALVDVARRNLEELGLGDRVTIVPGRFQDTLDGVLASEAPVDYAFIDGHHDRDATIAYFEQLLPALAEDAVVVFDDISWSRGMQAAWRAVSAHPRVRVPVDLFKVGVCVLGPEQSGAESFRVAID